MQKAVFIILVLSLSAFVRAEQKFFNQAEIKNSPELQTIIDKATRETIAKFAAKNFKAENLAITLIDLSNENKFQMANFRGEERIYPASVVKLFYLVAAYTQLETGKIKNTPELDRAIKDMIVASSNDATHFIVDVLTGTSSGAELNPKELKDFAFKRNTVNRHFAALGYQNINVNQKTYCEDAYGREQQFLKLGGGNRNKLTTNATARLFSQIVTGQAVSSTRSKQMMDLLKREFTGRSNDPDDQAHGFTGIALSPGDRLWSKAGWTSTTRHDAAYVETADGSKFVLVVFTENFAKEYEIIPTVTRIVLAGLRGS